MAETDLFKWRHYESEIILLCVRWYLRYALSYRDLEEMMNECGLSVDHTTIYRWVQRYAPEAVAFWLILALYLSSVLWAFLTASALSQQATYSLIIALLLSYQLLRMYHYLNQFEEELSEPKRDHFLELLDNKYSRTERILRFSLAAVIVLFPKLAEYHQPSHGVSYMPAVILALCFLLLLVWDSVVWRGLKSTASAPCTPAWDRARIFFYLPNDSSAPSQLGPYWREHKFWERVMGLMMALAALFYVFFPHPSVFTILAVFTILFILWPLFGSLRYGNKWQGCVSEWWRALISYPVNPIFTVGDLCLGGSNMNTTETYKRRRFVRAYVFCLMTLGLCTLLQLQCSHSNKPAPELKQIRIATSKNLWCALTLIANAKGYFRAHGLDPKVNYQAAGRLNMDSLLGNATDFANVVETNIAYQALNRNSNLAIVGRIVSARDFAILTQGSAGVRRPTDLVGKRLAYAQATGAESFLFWFLEKEGISTSRLTLIPLQPAGLVDHFLGGGADAVATWEPFVSTIRSRSKNLGPTFETDGASFAGTMNVATLRIYAEANPSIVTAYARAMEDAASLVTNDPPLAQNIVAEQTGLPVETVRAIWNRFDFQYTRSTPK